MGKCLAFQSFGVLVVESALLVNPQGVAAFHGSVQMWTPWHVVTIVVLHESRADCGEMVDVDRDLNENMCLNSQEKPGPTVSSGIAPFQE